MKMQKISLIASCVVVLSVFAAVARTDEPPRLKRWQPGRGWGWVWGPGDERGALNEMTDARRLAALQAVRTGRTFDLGVTYDRNSFKWPGHNAGEIMSYRSPEGVKRQGDFAPAADDVRHTAWHSCAVFISDNVGTQIDGLAHAVEGKDDHWYGGFTEQVGGGDFGVRKCDAAGIPPIIARGVLIDVAGLRGVEALPPHTPIGPDDLQAALARQKIDIRPGDVVLIRTGAVRYWNNDDADERRRLAAHDTAGITLDAARWLVAEKGAMLIGSDTSGLEYGPPADAAAEYRRRHGSFMPVHNYLLIEQGVHIGELHYLEDLAQAEAWEFAYICTTAKIRGTVSGFALRPIAVE